MLLLGLLHTSSDLSVFFDVNQESSSVVSEKSRVHVQNQMGTTVVDIQQEHRIDDSPMTRVFTFFFEIFLIIQNNTLIFCSMRFGTFLNVEF